MYIYIYVSIRGGRESQNFGISLHPIDTQKYPKMRFLDLESSEFLLGKN